jgi:hypothetical protein
MKNNTTNDLCENNRTSCPWKSKVFIENNYIMHNGRWPAAENLLAALSAILIVREEESFSQHTTHALRQSKN